MIKLLFLFFIYGLIDSKCWKNENFIKINDFNVGQLPFFGRIGIDSKIYNKIVNLEFKMYAKIIYKNPFFTFKIYAKNISHKSTIFRIALNTTEIKDSFFLAKKDVMARVKISDSEYLYQWKDITTNKFDFKLKVSNIKNVPNKDLIPQKGLIFPIDYKVGHYVTTNNQALDKFQITIIKLRSGLLLEGELKLQINPILLKKFFGREKTIHFIKTFFITETIKTSKISVSQDYYLNQLKDISIDAKFFKDGNFHNVELYSGKNIFYSAKMNIEDTIGVPVVLDKNKIITYSNLKDFKKIEITALDGSYVILYYYSELLTHDKLKENIENDPNMLKCDNFNKIYSLSGNVLNLVDQTSSGSALSIFKFNTKKHNIIEETNLNNWFGDGFENNFPYDQFIKIIHNTDSFCFEFN